jgi:hypothetical protein
LRSSHFAVSLGLTAGVLPASVTTDSERLAVENAKEACSREFDLGGDQELAMLLAQGFLLSRRPDSNRGPHHYE